MTILSKARETIARIESKPRPSLSDLETSIYYLACHGWSVPQIRCWLACEGIDGPPLAIHRVWSEAYWERLLPDHFPVGKSAVYGPLEDRCFSRPSLSSVQKVGSRRNAA